MLLNFTDLGPVTVSLVRSMVSSMVNRGVRISRNTAPVTMVMTTIVISRARYLTVTYRCGICWC